MSKEIVSTTVEILGKTYPIRCQEEEVKALQEAALFLNQQMREVQDSGKAINLERIAIITALNIAHRCLQAESSTNTYSSAINKHILQLQEKLDEVFNKGFQTELIYSTEQS